MNETKYVSEINGYTIKDKNAQNEIENIKENFEKRKTKLIVIGDSWSDPAYSGIWQNILANDLNLTLKNYAVGGAGFVHDAIGLISAQVTQFLAEDIPEEDIKYVVVVGGLNDYAHSIDVNTTFPAIKSCLDSLRTAYPKTKILYVSNCMIPYSIAQMTYWATIHYYLTNYTSLNLMNRIPFHLFTNETHLTEQGQKWLSQQIQTCLTGGSLHNYSDNRQFSDSNAEINYRTIYVDESTAMIHVRIKFLQNLTGDTYITVPATNVNYGNELVVNGTIGADYNNIIMKPTTTGIIVGLSKNCLAGDTFEVTSVVTDPNF